MSRRHQKTLRPALLDPAAEWERLSPEQQKALGLAMIAIGVADRHNFEPGWNWGTAIEAGLQAGADVLADAGITSDLPIPQAPDLSALGIRMCHTCGCTDDCGCPEGCSWVAENRCSSCEAA